MVIRSVNLSWRHPIIVVVTVIDIVFVLAVTAVVETLVVVVVVVPGFDVIPLPPPVPGLTIENGCPPEAGAGVSSRPSP